jgi:FAD/FMN-containing dehydrogenase
MEAARPRSFETAPARPSSADDGAQPAAAAPVVGAHAISAFAASLAGSIVLPGDESFESARAVHNARFDRQPSLIVRAADAADVARTVAFAAGTGLELAVRSGGHSVAGHGTSDGGIVLDLSPMKAILIDAERRLAWAQPGLTAGDVTAAAAAHGLAVPFGDTLSVGIGGLTTGGGIGFLTRKHGMTIDNLVAAEVVTADARILTVDEDHHPDLFWAIRGGGGNVGVVTRFVYRLVEVDTVVGGGIFLPATPDSIAGVVREARRAPDGLTLIPIVMFAPPAPFIPAERVGELALMVLGVFDGDLEAGQEAWAPIRALAEPIVDLVGPMPYPAIYQFTAAGEERGASSIRSWFAADLDVGDAARIIHLLGHAPSPQVMVQLRILGGAMARIAPGATAFSQRDAEVMVSALALHEPGGDPGSSDAWVSAVFDALADRRTGVYANFLGAEGEDRIRSAYPGGAYERLAKIKRRYDPANLFRLNQNVPPAGRPSHVGG